MKRFISFTCYHFTWLWTNVRQFHDQQGLWWSSPQRRCIVYIISCIVLKASVTCVKHQRLVMTHTKLLSNSYITVLNLLLTTLTITQKQDWPILIMLLLWHHFNAIISSVNCSCTMVYFSSYFVWQIFVKYCIHASWCMVIFERCSFMETWLSTKFSSLYL